MNYFEHHIGDYLRDTAHLSLLEHGVYRRLLDVYYTREEPLPADCGRLIGARSRDEKAALKAVLDEFFEQAGDGWSHRRCDAEIARFKGKREKAKASADARWSKSERNANAYADGMRTHDEPDMRTHDERNATRAEAPARPQTPDTRHQTPEEQGAHPDATTSRALPPEPEPPKPGPVPGSGSPYGLAVLAMRQQGMADANPGHATLRALVDAGVTIEEFQAVSAEAVGKQRGFAWALATLTNRRRDAAAAPIPAKVEAQAQPTNPDVAATQARLNAEAARAITKPPAELLARRAALRTGEPT